MRSVSRVNRRRVCIAAERSTHCYTARHDFGAGACVCRRKNPTSSSGSVPSGSAVLWLCGEVQHYARLQSHARVERHPVASLLLLVATAVSNGRTVVEPLKLLLQPSGSVPWLGGVRRSVLGAFWRSDPASLSW